MFKIYLNNLNSSSGFANIIGYVFKLADKGYNCLFLPNSIQKPSPGVHEKNLFAIPFLLFFLYQ